VRLHHIGLIEHNLEKSHAIYQKLGFQEISEVIRDPLQHNKLLFLRNPESKEVLELIEPLNGQSPVFNAPDGYHHLCYEIENLAECAVKFKTDQIGKIFTKQIAAPAFQGRRIAFAYLKNGSLIEFLEME